MCCIQIQYVEQSVTPGNECKDDIIATYLQHYEQSALGLGEIHSQLQMISTI